MTRMSTRDKIATLAHDEGWRPTKDIPMVQEFRRGELEVTVGYDKRGHLQWIALFRDKFSIVRAWLENDVYS